MAPTLVKFDNVTTYPKKYALLQREMDKILSDPNRRKRIEKATRYLKVYIGGIRRKSSTRRHKTKR